MKVVVIFHLLIIIFKEITCIQLKSRGKYLVNDKNSYSIDPWEINVPQMESKYII